MQFSIYSQMAIQYQTPLDRTFHALGDGTRRKIISMLVEQGMCSAKQIQMPFNVAQPTISKHLKVLERAGLIKREIDGRSHNFELVKGKMSEAESWISRHTEFWNGALGQLEQHLKESETHVEHEDKSR